MAGDYAVSSSTEGGQDPTSCNKGYLVIYILAVDSESMSVLIIGAPLDTLGISKQTTA